MKKLFISQPMNGKSDKEIMQERERAIACAREAVCEDVEVITRSSGLLLLTQSLCGFWARVWSFWRGLTWRTLPPGGRRPAGAG